MGVDARGEGRLRRVIKPLHRSSPWRVDEAELRAAVAGKLVLVTGASYGLGEATARRLAGAGATVLLTARSAERLEEVVAEIRAAGGSAHAHAADLTDAQSVAALAQWVLDAHPPLDIVVSNAGKSIRRSIALSYDRFHDVERTVGVNYLGPVRLLLALLPSMRARGTGHVIGISTIGIRVPPAARWGAYLASKGAFDTWLRSAAPELRNDGVFTTSVYIGLMRTRMSAAMPGYNRLPAETPEEAAEAVCRAIVRRPRSIAPLGIPTLEVATTATRSLCEAASTRFFRFGEDTDAARRGAGGGSAPDSGSDPLLNLRLGWRVIRALRGAGVIAPVPPSRLPAVGRALRMGKGSAVLVGLGAARCPERAAIADERGEVSYRELDRRGAALAGSLRDEFGVEAGTPIGIMCRNHRGFIEAVVAGSRLGATVLLLNTDFPAPQLARILARERPALVIHDEEFAPLFADSGFGGARIVAWHDGDADGPTLDELASGPAPKLGPPAQPERVVQFTSGTTGVPKSAPRQTDPLAVLAPVSAFLSTIPLRAGESLLVAPPLFHSFGSVTVSIGFLLGSTVVLRRRFDAETTLADIEKHRVQALAAVPVMLDRILRCPAETRESHDTSSLRAILTGASLLSASTSEGITEAFGDVLYNLYGSSEAGLGSIAGPADLRAAPGTIGRPQLGIDLRILTAERREAAPGEVGNIFVGSKLVFEGYSSDDAQKEMVGGLLNTGDLGHRDEEGRLFIDGREDTMIVSGGENVFPDEVVDVLSGHAAIADVAVVGVDDEEFGQRLRAYVVPAPGAEPTEEELRLHVRERLPRFQIPRDFVFVTEIPRTATGKVRLRALDAAA